MQYLKITENTKLKDLTDRVGLRNIETILSVNNLKRTPDIGKYALLLYNSIMKSTEDVPPQRKKTLLNGVVDNSDIFEIVALLNPFQWRLFHTTQALWNTIKIPETIKLPDSTDVIGNGIHIVEAIYKKCMKMLSDAPYEIDPSVFDEYSTIANVRITEPEMKNFGTVNWFHIPWGEVTIYSSLRNQAMDIPVYPEDVSDGVSASYTQMPNMLFQYEPWYLYESSGPRSLSLKFHMHRDMWSGDHNDGRCNALIRFCEASCYPKYQGAAVYSDLVTLYIHGQPLIRGILTKVDVQWSGPLGHDGWYLECSMTLQITEVSNIPLNFDTQNNKALIR